MKRKAGLLFLLPLLLVPIAYAKPHATATGTFTTSDVIVAPPQFDDGDTILTVTTTLKWTGTFTGTTIAVETLVIHADGTLDFEGVGTFTGTVAGMSGTATNTYEGHGSLTPGCGGSGSIGCFVVSTEFGDGTGSLAGLEAEGTFPGTIPAPLTSFGTYALQLEFD